MSNRYLLRSALMVMVIVSCLHVTRSVAQSIPVSMGRNATSLAGVDLLLPIEIDMRQRSEKLRNFTLTLRWNKDVLQLVGGSGGTFGEVDSDEDSLAFGVIKIFGQNDAGIGGLFTVAIGRFRPLVNDTTTIELAVDTLTAAETFADLTPDAAPSDRLYCAALGRYGDVDGDGAANSRDALIALSASVGLDVSQFNISLADVDGDGVTQAVDALIILSNGLGIDVSAFRVLAIAPGTCATAQALASFLLVPGDATVVVGTQLQYTVQATDSSGATVAVNDVFWSVSDERGASITPDGIVGTLDTGTTTVTAIQNGTRNRAQAVVTVIGTDILFFSDREGNNEIYRMSADITGSTNLTNNPAFSEFDPAWSPDRTRFAFFSNRAGNGDIYIANIDGTGVTQLTTNTATDIRPHWSPDGNKIVFRSDRDGNFEIYVINVDGTGLTRLTNDSGFDSAPAWSPDGSQIAFTSNRDGDTDIYVMNADGTGVTNLTNDTIVDIYPAWSPDGSRIAFTSGTGSELDIYVMNADGSNRIQLTFEAGPDRVPDFSPDGSLIVFASDRDGDLELYVMNAIDGSNLVQLTHNTAVDYRPRWQ